MRHTVASALVGCLSLAGQLLGQPPAAPAAAPAWVGPAAVGIRVQDEGGKPVPGAEVTLRWMGTAPAAGPATLLTDTRGEAVAGHLAEGTWYLEVHHADFMVLTGQVEARAGKTARRVYAEQVSSAGVWKPLRIELFKVRSMPPLAAATAAAAIPPAPASAAPRSALAAPTSAAAGPRSASPPAPVPPPAASPSPQPPEPAAPPAIRATPRPAPPVPTATAAPTPMAPLAPAPPAPAPRSTPPALSSPPGAPPAPAPPALSAPRGPAAPPAASPPRAAPAATPPSPARAPAAAAVAPAPSAASPATAAARGTTAPSAAMAARPVAAAATLRSGSQGTCPECGAGEWALTTEVAAAAASAGAACEDFAAALGAPFGAAAKGPPDAPLAYAAGPARPCVAVAVVLPAGARFVGYRFEALDAAAGGDCIADQECAVRQARWHGHPAVIRGPRTVVWGVFENRSPDSPRRARLTAYFAPATGWAPPATP